MNSLAKGGMGVKLEFQTGAWRTVWRVPVAREQRGFVGRKPLRLNRRAASAARLAIARRSLPHSAAMLCRTRRTSSINVVSRISSLHVHVFKKGFWSHNLWA